MDDLVQELVPSYLAARREEVTKMTELLARSDFEQLRVLSHSLKGSGASFGFPELTRLGSEMEGYAAERDNESFAQALVRLKAYLEELDQSGEDRTGA
jgi:HPt (histidine-containing phosphotransfer) domain-containing protein